LEESTFSLATVSLSAPFGATVCAITLSRPFWFTDNKDAAAQGFSH